MMWRFDAFGDRVAVIGDDGEQYTYSQLGQAQERLAGQIPGRCLVFCLCRNSVGSLLGYGTFINHRILPLLLDASLDRELLRQLVESYKPDYFWVPEDIAPEFPMCKNLYSDLGYSLLKTEYDAAFPLHEDLALLLTTSGSTGSPKLVRQSYRNLRANTESIVEYLELDESERPITTLPMSYTYGLSILNTHLYVGALVILTQMPVTKWEFWQKFRQYGATSFGGVPYIYEMLDRLRFYGMDLKSLRTMTQAGGKLAPELHKKVAEYALATRRRFVVMYGQTEATARMAYLPHEKSLEKYGSMGIAIPGGRFSLIDAEGDEIAQPEVTGELVYEGGKRRAGLRGGRRRSCKGRTSSAGGSSPAIWPGGTPTGTTPSSAGKSASSRSTAAGSTSTRRSAWSRRPFPIWIARAAALTTGWLSSSPTKQKRATCRVSL